jgi:lysyl-tRNA synthetase class 2
MRFLLVLRNCLGNGAFAKRLRSGFVMPSSVILSFRYLSRTKQLEIVFVSGRRYLYLEVPEKTYAAMCRSFSKGEFFNACIRDRYAFVRLEDVRIAS